ncbi:STAS domain-containing protein [Streptomyces sp. NPDC004284]|uniref:STAS domain-containing protein n=1 Tax=Streptomyces sp. NPDC004284 TaxID=3364695 RepID=UPI0036B74CE1
MTSVSDAFGRALILDGEAEGDIAVSARMTESGASVSIRGELDLSSAPYLRTSLLQVMAACADGGGLTLDLSQVPFCDSTGLNVLLRARQRAVSEHRTLTIAAASPQVMRLLEMTGAAPLFTGKT